MQRSANCYRDCENGQERPLIGATVYLISKEKLFCGDVLPASFRLYLYKGGEQTEMKSRSSQSWCRGHA